MIDTLAVLFIPIILGYALVHLKYLEESINSDLKLFVMRVTVPATIFIAMLNLDLETVKQIIPLSIGFILLTALQMIFYFIFIRIKDQRVKAAYILTMTFGNYGYVGWAVLDSALGSEGLTRGMFFNSLWWPVIYLSTFIIGKVSRLEGKLDIKRYRINIIIPSAVLVLGILFNFLGIKIYPPVLTTVKNLGNMTVPLILFSIGLSISIGESMKNLKRAILPVLLRPVAGFIVALIVIRIVGFKDPVSRESVLLVSTMPVGVTTVILGEMIGLDEKLTSSIMILSTLLSLATIPLTIFLLHI